MNFYLSLIDDRCKPGKTSSIGIILCRDKSDVTVEYALRDVRKPIGVAGYEVNFTKAIPEYLKGDLPTIEDLEQELRKMSKYIRSLLMKKLMR